jgi:hypothetical protein
MIVSITPDGNLLFRAEDKYEVVKMRKAFKKGHLHFSCKSLHKSFPDGAMELLLVPSIIRWARPKRGI